MINSGDVTQQVSAGRLEGSGRSESLLQRLREQVEPHDRLDPLARITAVAAGPAVLAALPLKLDTAAFGSRAPLGIHVTRGGQVTRFGTDAAGAIDHHAPVHG